MKRVIKYGVYDSLHYGHIKHFRRVKALGNYLILLLRRMGLIRMKNTRKLVSHINNANN